MISFRNFLVSRSPLFLEGDILMTNLSINILLIMEKRLLDGQWNQGLI